MQRVEVDLSGSKKPPAPVNAFGFSDEEDATAGGAGGDVDEKPLPNAFSAESALSSSSSAQPPESLNVVTASSAEPTP